MEEPRIDIQTNQGKMSLFRSDTELITHAPERFTEIDGIKYENDRFDHIWHIFKRLGNKVLGMPLFTEQLGQDNFQELAQAMAVNEYHLDVNKREVDQTDQNLYMQFLGATATNELKELEKIDSPDDIANLE